MGEALERHLQELRDLVITVVNQIFLLLQRSTTNLNERILKLRRSTHPSKTKAVQTNFFIPSHPLRKNS